MTLPQPELFTNEEWQRLPPALQMLGEPGALNAMLEGGTKIVTAWNSMTLAEQEAASAMMETWPKEYIDPEWPPLPVELTELIDGYDTPLYEASEHVRECRRRLERLQEWHRYLDPAALEADIQALIDDGCISDRQAALDWLKDGFTLQALRDIDDILSDRPEAELVTDKE